MTGSESRARGELVDCARELYARRLSHGSTGNISTRWRDRILVTGTGSSLGTVTAESLSVIDIDGRHIAGPPPSKEAFLHAALLRARPAANAVVHTHSTHAAAVSCLADIDPASAIPPLTAYFRMRVDRLPLLPFFAPGDERLGQLAERTAAAHGAMLLRNHGPIAAGSSLTDALDVIEEIEETAKILLLIGQRATHPVPTRDAWHLDRVSPPTHETTKEVRDE